MKKNMINELKSLKIEYEERQLDYHFGDYEYHKFEGKLDLIDELIEFIENLENDHNLNEDDLLNYRLSDG